MKNRLAPSKIIMAGFLLGAILGTILLSLPAAAVGGRPVKLEDAAFVATSAICVTGLSTVNIGLTFSGFGQVVLLLLIQFGGLGIVTFTTLMLILFRRRITLGDRLLIQNAYNLDSLEGLGRLTLRIFKTTLILEAIGAAGYALVFIPEFGIKGVWYSVFHSVSAFCNAGIDLLGGNSLTAYRDNLIINITTVYLIIVSGLGFPVYWDVCRVFATRRENRRRGMIRRLSAQAKLVFLMTALLVVGGCVLTLLFEYDNPDTLGELAWGDKVMAAVFQSVTLRTAGFVTIDQSYFRPASCLVFVILMFIGGSPAGTAGGVKTVTVGLLLASMVSDIKGRGDTVIFNRKVSDRVIRRCMAIILFSFISLLTLTVTLMCVQEGDFLDIVYEMTSAIATVGLSRGLTGSLNTLGKLIVMLAMYLGRIGPITLALAFSSNQENSKMSHPETRMIVG